MILIFLPVRWLRNLKTKAKTLFQNKTCFL